MGRSLQELIVLARYAAMRSRLDEYEAEALKVLLADYNKAAAQVRTSIKALDPKDIAEIRQQKRLLSELDAAVVAISDAVVPAAVEAIVEAGVYSYTTINNILSWDGRVVDYNMVSMSRQQITAMVTAERLGDKTIAGWMEGAIFAPVTEFRQQLSVGMIKGEGYKKIVDRLMSGLAGNAVKRDIETITKSYIQSVNASANKAIFAANRDIVKDVEWSAIMEFADVKTGRGTCVRCQALDGQRWPHGSQHPEVILHPRCRCMLLPVTPTWPELGLDAQEMEDNFRHWYDRDESGQINARGKTVDNFGDWFEHPPVKKTTRVKWQDNAVGPVRAGLVRSGAVSFSNLVDKKTGVLIPVEKLKEAAE